MDFPNGSILVPAAIAKTGRRRKIVMPEIYARARRPTPAAPEPSSPRTPRKQTAALSTTSGVSWRRNALRHSFGSYRMEATKNAGQVSLEMGNSVAVVLSHYFEIVDVKAAAAYWNLRPTGPATNILNIATAAWGYGKAVVKKER